MAALGVVVVVIVVAGAAAVLVVVLMMVVVVVVVVVLVHTSTCRRSRSRNSSSSSSCTGCGGGTGSGRSSCSSQKSSVGTSQLKRVSGMLPAYSVSCLFGSRCSVCLCEQVEHQPMPQTIVLCCMKTAKQLKVVANFLQNPARTIGTPCAAADAPTTLSSL